MKKIRVALLDSGIADELSDSVDIIGKKQFYYDYYEDKIVVNDIVKDYNGHGTSCVDTIISMFTEVEFYIVKMLGITGITDGNVFASALEFAGDLDVDIIAICSSFIDERHDDKIRLLCKKIHSQGKIIISAVQNGLEVSSPADYDGVIGVICGLMEDDTYCYDDSKKIQMQCSGNEVTARGCNGIYSAFQGNSRAAAVATAIVANLLYNSDDSDANINDLLKKEAGSVEFKSNYFKNEYDCIEDIPFDCEKEKFYIENDENYHRLIYLLCEFFFVEDTNEIRTSDLLELRGRDLLRRLGNLLDLVRERFDIPLERVDISDLQWAYLFYEKYIRSQK